MDARERRKLQNRVAQRNFRRRQALKEKQQRNQQQGSENPIPPETSGMNVEQQSNDSRKVAAPPHEVQSSSQASNKQDEIWVAVDYPAVSTLTSHELNSHSPSHMPAGPISPVSFPLFCSPQELISDNQKEHTRDDGPDACHSRFPGDLPPISLRITPQPTDPLAQHCPLEPVKHLAVPNARRASVSSNPPARKQPLSSAHRDQMTSNATRRHSSAIPSQHSGSSLDQSISFYGDAKYSEGKTTLHICAEKGHTNVLRFLLDHGAELDATDFAGRTALHYATTRGHTDSVSVLLEQGADTELADEFGRTPLHVAVELGYEAVVRLLVREGADPNARIAGSTQPQS
ncbi:hypothetical protein AFLA70_189g002451 [Aspergillus flavus AF70]|nr:hypothetical protein AFLA70_189g002451 [Aspergillus flavus AF70]